MILEPYKELYRLRKEKIKRVFADAKEKHGMRYTQYKDLAQMTNWLELKSAAMNLKKLVTWKWNDSHPNPKRRNRVSTSRNFVCFLFLLLQNCKKPALA